MAILIGQFLNMRTKNADTPADPYNPQKESFLELALPEVSNKPVGPAPLPPPPKVDLSNPAGLPLPPSVILGTPSALPPVPPVVLSSPSALPPESAPPASTPSVLPPPPGVVLSTPTVLPAEPSPPQSTPGIVPPPPAVVLSSPGALPASPSVPQSVPAGLPDPSWTDSTHAVFKPDPDQAFKAPVNPATPLPNPNWTDKNHSVFKKDPDQAIKAPVNPAKDPAPTTGDNITTSFVKDPDQAFKDPNLAGRAAALPDPTWTDSYLLRSVFKPDPDQAIKAPVNPAKDPGPVTGDQIETSAKPSSGYAILGSSYSPMISPADPGSLAFDPFMYERQLERGVKLGPGKLLLHSLNQVQLFAQNSFGNVWNPTLIAPPPILQNFISPALDLGLFDANTESKQLQIQKLYKEARGGDTSKGGTVGTPTSRMTMVGDMARMKPRSTLTRVFENISNVLSPKPSVGADDDKLIDSAFTNGVIPMRLKGENAFGFITFQQGKQQTSIDDTEAYVPLSFTDLRPVGTTFRTVFFRPLITEFSENFTPEWNKAQYFGRVDPVATYQSTGRSIRLGFKLVAFGPEDIRTIYQKLHWLASMVYPEYDGNLSYRSGPVVRLRIGDIINADGPEKSRGLPGIIDSLDFDYGDTLWELEKGNKIPRNIDVALSFTVLHDVPIGRGIEGRFGGLGAIDKTGKFVVTSKTDPNGEMPDVHESSFRSSTVDGERTSRTYTTLAGADDEKIK